MDETIRVAIEADTINFGPVDDVVSCCTPLQVSY